MSETREAMWAETQPDADGDSRFWKVGSRFPGFANGAVITRITVQCDLPGLHCDLWRVCVWVGDNMAVEAPLHSLQAVGYPEAQQ